MYIVEIDGWSFEVVSIRARRAPKFGDKYDAIANITVTDGIPHIEGLLTNTTLTYKDKNILRKYLKEQGFSTGVFSRLRHGLRKPIKLQ